MDFSTEFERLTGFPPMNWQTRLYVEYFSKGRLPDAVDIPTGLGKTAVMAIWYIALKQGASLPTRMVYVVDRRSVVDQATIIAETIKEKTNDEDLRISTLRGQHADNREWLEDPSAPAIIVGTVDMIGSRLLFSGYGVSRRMRPFHAGLLGAGTIVVLDESHLVPPFERLLESIDKGVELFGPGEVNLRSFVPPFKLLSLSATGREKEGTVFRLDDGKGDMEDGIVKTRLGAPKRLIIREVAKKNIVKELADQAWKLSGNGEKQVRVLVYCDKREMATKVSERLKRQIEKRNRKTGKGHGFQFQIQEPELFVGARRVKERADAQRKLSELGFLPGSEAEIQGPAFLIATSAGEVGVDLDANHMVCDLVSWERIIQRLGRVNRLGKGNSEIVLLHGGEPKPKNPQKPNPAEKRELTAWNVLRIVEELPHVDGGVDVSPGALRTLKMNAEKDSDLKQRIEAGTTPPPLYPALTRPLVDAWSMTSLEKHTGRPEIDPWLRGWIEDKPQTAVVWRRYMPIRTEPGRVSDRQVEDFFDAAPLHLTERLETRTCAAVAWLLQRISTKAFTELSQEQVTAIALSPDRTCIKQYNLGDLLKEAGLKPGNRPIFRELSDNILVVDAGLGGLSQGLLDADADAEDLRTADDGEEWVPDVGFSIRRREDGQGTEEGMRVVYRFPTKLSAEGEEIESLLVESTVNEKSRATSPNPQLLDDHQNAVAKHVVRLARSLGLTEDYVRALEFAARVHDIGKQEERWQRGFNAPQDGIYAKTKGPVLTSYLGRYRHEFGSLFHLRREQAFESLSPDLQDLVQHLVVSHHGRGRPIIDSEGFEAAPPSLLRERVLGIALRFARLQKRWGPWGLAWWEALFRAADQQASRENDIKEVNNGRS